MKRAMVGILAAILLAAFASPVMAISPYSADVKRFTSQSTDCGNVVVTNGGTLIAVIDLGANNTACAPNPMGTTLDVCAVLNGVGTLVTQISDTNPQDGRIGLLEGTKVTVFGSNAFDFLEFRAPADTCGGTVEYTSGQPR